MKRGSMLRELAVRDRVALPWFSRMILWSHLRGHPFGHAQTCCYAKMLREAGARFDFKVDLP